MLGTAVLADAGTNGSFKLCIILVLIEYFLPFLLKLVSLMKKNVLINTGKGRAGCMTDSPDEAGAVTEHRWQVNGCGGGANSLFTPVRLGANFSQCDRTRCWAFNVGGDIICSDINQSVLLYIPPGRNHYLRSAKVTLQNNHIAFSFVTGGSEFSKSSTSMSLFPTKRR